MDSFLATNFFDDRKQHMETQILKVPPPREQICFFLCYFMYKCFAVPFSETFYFILLFQSSSIRTLKELQPIFLSFGAEDAFSFQWKMFFTRRLHIWSCKSPSVYPMLCVSWELPSLHNEQNFSESILRGISYQVSLISRKHSFSEVGYSSCVWLITTRNSNDFQSS